MTVMEFMTISWGTLEHTFLARNAILDSLINSELDMSKMKCRSAKTSLAY